MRGNEYSVKQREKKINTEGRSGHGVRQKMCNIFMQILRFYTDTPALTLPVCCLLKFHPERRRQWQTRDALMVLLESREWVKMLILGLQINVFTYLDAIFVLTLNLHVLQLFGAAIQFWVSPFSTKPVFTRSNVRFFFQVKSNCIGIFTQPAANYHQGSKT